MKQKLIIALKVLTYLQSPRMAVPVETYGAVNYIQSQVVRIDSRSKRSSSTYSIARGEKLLYNARYFLHRCWKWAMT